MLFINLLFWILLSSNSKPSTTPPPSYCCPENVTLGEEFEGKASYYGVHFHGKKTANGEVMNKSALTCAHPLLPFGTMIEVTNMRNGKKVIVRVNDRGPFSHKRVIDVSVAAAEELDMIHAGVQHIRGMIVGCCGEVYISSPAPANEETH